MQFILMVIVAFAALLSGTNSQFEDYPEDDYGSGDGNQPTTESRTSALEPLRSLVFKLYGSADAAQENFWEKYDAIRCEAIFTENTESCFEKAWALDDLRLVIQSKEQSDVLTETEMEKLLSAVEKEIQSLLNTSVSDYDYLSYFTDVRKSRSHLDCVLGREMMTEFLIKIKPSQKCWHERNDSYLWIKAINHVNDEKNCYRPGAFNDLVRIAQAPIKKNSLAQHDEDAMTLSAELLQTLSKQRNLEYLGRITCGEDYSPMDCSGLTNNIGDVVCEPLSLGIIECVEELARGKLVGKPLSSPDDMEITMDILSDVAKTVEQLSKSNKQGHTRTLTINALNSYLDLMDSAIGKSCQEIWAKMDKDNFQEKQQMVLANNEKFIGAMFKLFFSDGGDESTVLDKETMKLWLKKVSQSNTTANVDFNFAEANIQTDLLTDDLASDLNVYAIYYKSWADLQQREGLKEANSTSNRMKHFVGKGGIISLSALAEDGKRSVPVSYKMKFDNSTGIKRYCMSCEYLNMATGVWENTGCNVKEVDNVGVTCKCNHTTNFAAFMSPVPIDINMTKGQIQAKKIVSYVGSAVSVFALALSLVIFNIVRPTVKNDRLNAHINLAFALFVVHAIQLTSDFVVRIDAACLISAILTHFFLLGSFFWMLIEGIFLYLYVVQVFIHSASEYLRWLYVLGWTLPAVIVAISAGIGIPRDIYLDVRQKPCAETEFLYPPMSESKYESCWVSSKTGMSWSFIAPALVIILFNTIVLGKVFQVLKKISANNRSIRPFQAPSGKKQNGYTGRIYVRNDSEIQRKYENSEPNTEEEIKLKEAENGVKGNYGDCHGSRVPSKAYMHNLSQSKKPLPVRNNSTGKYFVEDVKVATKGAVVLLPILGIPWICGLWVAHNYTLLMIFLVLNSTQGLVIFTVYCLMNGEVKRALRRHLEVSRLRSRGSSRSRSSSTSSLRSLNSRFTKTWRSKSGSYSTSK